MTHTETEPLAKLPAPPLPQPGGLGSMVGLFGWCAASFAAAGIGSQFPPGDWYATLVKPSWNPPNSWFGPVWSVLFTLMGIAAWRVWRRGGFAAHPVPLGLFVAQLVFNAAWSWLFFGLKAPGLAFFEILILWGLILATLLRFLRIDRPAGWMLIPYLAWVTFASVLNFTLWRLNPG